MDTERLAQRILWHGLDDWVALHVLLGEAKKALPTPAQAFKDAVVAALDYLLQRELAEIGELGEVGFVAWKGTAAEIIVKVVSRCDETGWRLGGFDELWLSNTSEGMRMAELATPPTEE